MYVDNNSNEYANSENIGIRNLAWQHLKQGQHSLALTGFASEAQTYPDSGVPKAGFALATASKGDLDRAIWAMRRAFRIDPDSLHYLQLDEMGHLLIDNLIGQYVTQENSDIDQAFMVSALYYLKHDYQAAKETLASAEKLSDKSVSTRNLQRLINQEFDSKKRK